MRSAQASPTLTTANFTPVLRRLCNPFLVSDRPPATLRLCSVQAFKIIVAALTSRSCLVLQNRQVHSLILSSFFPPLKDFKKSFKFFSIRGEVD